MTAPRHPLLRELLKPYINKFGDRLYLSLLLVLGGFDFRDLPKVRANMTGDRDQTCWPHVLGNCRKRACTRAHMESVSDPLAQELCCLLRPGVTWALANAAEHTREVQNTRGIGGSVQSHVQEVKVRQHHGERRW